MKDKVITGNRNVFLYEYAKIHQQQGTEVTHEFLQAANGLYCDPPLGETEVMGIIRMLNEISNLRNVPMSPERKADVVNRVFARAAARYGATHDTSTTETPPPRG